MDISFLITTKHRTEDLRFTLNKLKQIVNISIHEVLVFIDGCSETERLIKDFDWVIWTISHESICASPARAILYKKAKGTIFIGLDDDAHPLSENFIASVQDEFKKDASIGILTFQEVRGLFKNDVVAKTSIKQRDTYFTADFVGCGFAISKTAYNSIVGFPKFIDIYGEEPCVALQVLDSGFNIKYVPNIAVNHRVDVEKRKQQGKNYFRFEKQLQNSIRFYLVYYPKPLVYILKLLFHNFKKYALNNLTYFKLFFKVVFIESLNIKTILKFRNPVKQKTLEIKNQLKGLIY
jgi:GT2 family glycosyltransferase